MKNTAKQLIGVCMIAVFTFSCSNNTNKPGHDTTLEIEDENRIITNEEESSSTRNLNELGRDTASNNRQGAANDRMGNMDTQLPQPILDAIAKDSKLSTARILQQTKREESGQTVYEVSFQSGDGVESVIFDINGQRKQK